MKKYCALLFTSIILMTFSAGCSKVSTALSNHQSQIAFSAGGAANDIYLQDIKTGKLYNLTNNKADDFWPAWSPDGNLMAYTSDRTGNEDVFGWLARLVAGRQ